MAPEKYLPELDYRQAMQYAAGRAFKGAKGRLAIIKSQATHEFILQNLSPPTYTWIGLRFFCRQRELRWSNNETVKRGDWSAWHEKWDQGWATDCMRTGHSEGGIPWLPVAYTGVGEGFRWIVKGAAKNYNYLLVEYPTGHP